LFQVGIVKLRVEQHETIFQEVGDEMHECDFRRVSRAREHALTEESASERHAIKPAY
jgi:hypothetical protein